MEKHNSHPKKCEHILKHCEQCDVVYCETCKKEWKIESLQWSYSIPNTQCTSTYSLGTSIYNSHNHQTS